MIINCEQRSQEWYQARTGIPTASSFKKIVDTKGNPSKQRTAYMYQLAGERVVGCQDDGYQNGAMQRGVELEPEAREFYCLKTGLQVEEVGFVRNDDLPVGASPDGLVGEDGLLEIKCPTLPVMVSYLIKGTLPSEYFQQVQGQLYVTDRKWCDFLAYYPSMRPFMIRVERDAEFIAKLQAELKKFCEELDEVTEKIK